MEYLRNGEDCYRYIKGNHRLYYAKNNCPYHRTSLFKSFKHIHVDVPDYHAYVPNYKLDGYERHDDPITGAVTYESTGTFSTSEVKAYWDHYFSNLQGRGNISNVYSSDTVDLRQNCWEYSLRYSTWIEDPYPIYRDNYTQVTNNSPSSSGCCVIRVSDLGKDTHVINIISVDYQMTFNPVYQTREKFRHSGLYDVIYGLGWCTLTDYWHRN